MRLLFLLLILAGFALLLSRKGVSVAKSDDLHTPRELAEFFRNNGIDQHKLDAISHNLIDKLLPGDFPAWEKKLLDIHFQYGDWR